MPAANGAITTGHTAAFRSVAAPVVVMAIDSPLPLPLSAVRVVEYRNSRNNKWDHRGARVKALIAIFQLPIMLLNVFGTIGAVIWLLVIGEWRWVVAGILTMMFAPFMLGLAILPSIALGAPGIYFVKRRITILLYFFSLLSSIYIYGLISAWSGGVAYYFMRDAHGQSFWPFLVWSYCVATVPWTYMAQRESDSIASTLAAFFAQVAFIVLMIVVAFSGDLAAGVQVFSLVMLVGIFFHMRLLAEANRMGLLHAD